jgi:hypothetical protein
MRYIPKQSMLKRCTAGLASLALFSGCFQRIYPTDWPKVSYEPILRSQIDMNTSGRKHLKSLAELRRNSDISVYMSPYHDHTQVGIFAKISEKGRERILSTFIGTSLHNPVGSPKIDETSQIYEITFDDDGRIELREIDSYELIKANRIVAKNSQSNQTNLGAEGTLSKKEKRGRGALEEKVLTDLKTGLVTEKQVKYEAQEIILDNEAYYFRDRAAEVNPNLRNKGTPCFLTFTALPKKKTAKMIGQKVSFEPETPNDEYVFVLQTINNGEATIAVPLTTTAKTESSNSIPGKNPSKNLGVRTVTEDETPFNLETISLNTSEGIKEFYTRTVLSPDEKDSNTLPFLLIPKDKSVLKLSRTGPKGEYSFSPVGPALTLTDGRNPPTLLKEDIVISAVGPVYRGISTPLAQEYSSLLSKLCKKQNASQQTGQIETSEKDEDDITKAQRELDEIINQKLNRNAEEPSIKQEISEELQRFKDLEKRVSGTLFDTLYAKPVTDKPKEPTQIAPTDNPKPDIKKTIPEDIMVPRTAD